MQYDNTINGDGCRRQSDYALPIEHKNYIIRSGTASSRIPFWGKNKSNLITKNHPN